MLSKKQKTYLRKLASEMNPSIQMGKAGDTESFVKNLDNELTAHELVKVSLLKGCDLDVKMAAMKAAESTDSEAVQVIGRSFVLYRKNPKESRIELPRD